MKKVSPSVLVISTFCAIFILGFWALLMPQLTALSEAQGKLDLFEKQQLAHLDAPPSQQQAAVQSKDMGDLALTLLPENDNQYDLSVQLDALSKNTGVTLSNLSLSTSSTAVAPATTGVVASAGGTANAAVSQMTITLSISSNYANLQRFLKGLVSLNRFIQIDQITITGSSGTDTLSTQLTAFAYYLPVTTAPNP